MNNLGPAGSTVTSAVESIGSARTAISQQRNIGIAEQLNFTHDSISTAELPFATTALPQRVSRDAQRVGVLQSFSRSVERVGHVRMHAAHAGPVRPRAHTSGNGLIVGKRLSAPFIDAADGQVVHSAGRSCGHTIWYSLRQRAQKHVDNPLRSFDIPSGHSRRGA